jgi:hypothetical protein
MLVCQLPQILHEALLVWLMCMLQGKVLMIRFYEGPVAQDSRM